MLTLAASTSALAIPPETPDRILIVISGEGRDQGKTRPGYEMDELSQAWAIFRDNGFDVHIDRKFLYFAMAFSAGVETLNILSQRKHRRPS